MDWASIALTTFAVSGIVACCYLAWKSFNA